MSDLSLNSGWCEHSTWTLQGAHNWNLCIRTQLCVQLEPDRTIAGVQGNYIKNMDSFWTIQWENTIFNWKLSSCRIVNNAPLRACLSVHAWWKSTTFRGAGIPFFWEGTREFFHSKWPKPKEVYFSSLWAHSTSTSMLSSHNIQPELRGHSSLPAQPLTYHSPRRSQPAFLHFHLGPDLPRHSFH